VDQDHLGTAAVARYADELGQYPDLGDDDFLAGLFLIAALLFCVGVGFGEAVWLDLPEIGVGAGLQPVAGRTLPTGSTRGRRVFA